MADEQKTILVETNPQGVATVTMARPDVFNAFDERMIEELDTAFTDLENDPNIRAVILAGAGKHFSAGADLNWMKRASQADFSWNLEDSRRFAGMLYRIYSLPKPTIAKVHGVALGGGVGLTCACDFAIAATNARFSVSEAKFGILPSVIGPYLLNAVGRRHAKFLALTTTRVSAEDALTMGLVQKVVAPEALNQAVDHIVTELLAGGPTALQEIKNLFEQLTGGPISSDVRELTAQTISRVRGTDEAKEGFEAFFAKRDPFWKPKS